MQVDDATLGCCDNGAMTDLRSHDRARPSVIGRRRLALLAVPVAVLAAGCRLQIESDRADARALAARAGRSVERRSSEAGVPAADMRVLLDVTAELLGSERDSALDDLVDGHTVGWSGLHDADLDGIDDDRAIELSVDGTVVCVTLDDAAETSDGPC